MKLIPIYKNGRIEELTVYKDSFWDGMTIYPATRSGITFTKRSRHFDTVWRKITPTIYLAISSKIKASNNL